MSGQLCSAGLVDVTGEVPGRNTRRAAWSPWQPPVRPARIARTAPCSAASASPPATACTLAPQAEFPTNRGGLCSKGWTADRPARSPRTADRPAGPRRTGDGEPAAPVELGRGAGPHRRRDHRVQAARTGRRRRASAAAGSPTRRRTSSASSPGWRCARATSTTTAASACRRRRRRRNRAFGIDRGLPFPLADIAAGRRRAARRQQPRRHDAAGRCSSSTPDGPAAAGTSSSTRGGPPTARRRGPAPADRARHRPRARQRAAAPRASATGSSTRPTSRRAPPASTRSGARWPRTGPTGSSGITGVPVRRPRDAGRRCSARPRRGHDPHRPRRRAAAQRHRHRARPSSTSRSRSACPARPTRGWGTVTGQGNGQGGREHGQKADQLPGYRKLDDPAARAHVAGGLGHRPGRAARPGQVGLRDARPPRHRRRGARAAGASARNIVVSAPERPARRGAAEGAGLPRRVSDIFLSETAALADVVLPTAQWAEEDGTMTNLEGRVLRRRRHWRRRRACATTSRCSPRWPTGSAAGSTSPPIRATVFEELRRASAGGIADYAGHHLRADRRRARRLLAVPGSTGHPGTPRLFVDGFADARRPSPVHRRRAPAPAEPPRQRLPLLADDRPGSWGTTRAAPRPGGCRR